MNKIKITYIGALGKIGQKALLMLINEQPKNVFLEIILIASKSTSSTRRLGGFLKDFNGLIFSKNLQNRINIVITDDYKLIKNSDIVVCSAAKWSGDKDLKEIKDDSGRLIQTYFNKDLIIEIADNINKYSKKSLFAIITNQVDLLCGIVRNKFPDLNVIGIGGYIDSVRLKQVVNNKFKIDLDRCFMVGYHNSDMTLMTNSILKKDYRKLISDNYDTITDEVKNFGKNIYIEQKDESDRDTGASILPATAIKDLIKAYCFGKKLIAPFNVLVKNKDIIKKYCDNINCSSLELSIPVEITLNNIKHLNSYKLTDFEKQSIKIGIDNFNKNLNDILNV